jgi:ssDNA-binding Zn-finger/Zn-ribbon topoisomerase 1
MEQDSTGNFNDVWDIITHYRMRKGHEAVVNHAVEARVFKRLANIPPETRGKVIDWLLENRPRNFGLDLIAINEAVTHTRGYETAYVPAKKVTCECCGLEYQYRKKSNDEDKLHRSIFDRCPRCRYRAANTIQAQEYRAKNGKEEPGYIKHLEDYRADWIARGREWWYNREDELLIEKIQASGTEEEKEAMRIALAAEFEKMKARYLPWAVHSKAQAEEALQ